MGFFNGLTKLAAGVVALPVGVASDSLGGWAVTEELATGSALKKIAKGAQEMCEDKETD